MSDSPVMIVVDEALIRRIIREEVERVLGREAGPRLRLLTADEVGERLGVDRRTVLRWAREEGLPSRRLGPREVRFAVEDVLEWSETRRAG